MRKERPGNNMQGLVLPPASGAPGSNLGCQTQQQALSPTKPSCRPNHSHDADTQVTSPATYPSAPAGGDLVPQTAGSRKESQKNSGGLEFQPHPFTNGPLKSHCGCSGMTGSLSVFLF